MIKEENRIYTVKQGDTLQSIADQLQINVDDIIEFHNRHSNTFITESRPNLFGVDIIILPADLSEFRRRHNPNRLNLLYGDITLACEDIVIDEATELQMRGQNLIQAQTIQRFSVKQEEKDGHAISIIDCKEIIKRQISPEYKPLADTISFLGQPLYHLVLGINPNGEIAKIVNQEEIYERWNKLKQTKEAQILLADDVTGEKISQAMDTDYSQTLKVIKETLRYRLLCPDFWGDQTLGEVRHRETDLTLSSNFFSSHKIRFLLKETFARADETKGIIVTQEYSSMKEIQKELSGVYNSSLNDYLQTPMNYGMKIKCTFHLSGVPLCIQECHCHLQEKLNDMAVFTNEIHIKYNH
ncbi:LysM peptidoglycan-binding domain-containing protein [Prevotella melaninogenica]|jgi:hypothetical protein|uniref:LysM domain-containing protein n=1 Tax=Prevotella melaninogenica TaxID=28132 RepID=A0A250KMM9_9BACT|nr:LysM domain-containing protein [Prevotella melaninogenica]BBA29143.1 hypothetical protein PMEL1_01067 [Prevotella melaninogenica]